MAHELGCSHYSFGCFVDKWILTMITKHFFKILIIFIGMIVFGLFGVFVVNHFYPEQSLNTSDNTQVAK